MLVSEWAQAKVNLHLRIIRRREDGWHQLETVMQTLRLADRISLRQQPSGISLSCDHPALTCGEDNLAWRAAALLIQAYPGRGVSIWLEKRIPWQAGLGGGSSDAAAVLRGLNRLWRLGLPVERLEELGATLGSDVPFFIRGGTALASGRGEQIAQLAACPKLEVGLIVPPFGLATAAVYRRWQPPSAAGQAVPALGWSHLEQALLARDRIALLESLQNDLEAPAFSLEPDLAALKRRLLAEGLPALLSGSGSCLFVLLLGEDDRRLLPSLLPSGYRLLTTHFSPFLPPETAGETLLGTES